MRVVQVNFAFDPALPSAEALLERYATLTGWADALAQAGADVLTVQQFHSSANVTRRGVAYVFGSFREIASATAAWGPDVVHVNGLGFPVRTWRLRRALPPGCQTPVVGQDHASGTPGVRARALHRALRGLDAFLFSTLDQAQPWRDAGVIAPHQAVHAVMEASTAIVGVPQDAARAASGVAGDPAVLWVGRLNANKDPLIVLEGFERFAVRRPGATLTMLFHDGDLERVVRARVQVSDTLRERVRLAGAVPHDRIAAFFSAADVFVAGSHHEGSGYALLEALACGAAPAVTAIPTFRALTGDGHIGALWHPGDPDGCARALDLAAQTRDRQRVVDHFERNLSWEVVGRRAVQIYGDVMREKGSGSRNR